jgi:hypothetical protein
MATLTIDTTGFDQRIAAAFGRVLNLKDANGNARNATGPEVKQAVIGWLKMTVRETEQAVAREQAQATVTDISPT